MYKSQRSKKRESQFLLTNHPTEKKFNYSQADLIATGGEGGTLPGLNELNAQSVDFQTFGYTHSPLTMD